MTTCKNCDTEINQKYCPNCGLIATIKRIDGHYILHEIEHVLHLERGILYTVKELFINPGETVRHYISENRSRLVKPVIFIIVTSLIYTLINHFFHIEDQYVKSEGLDDSAIGQIIKWIQEHYGYANIMMGAFIAFWLKIFFRKDGYNFFEILILLCFVMGMGMLILALFALLQGITQYNLLTIGGMVAMIYAIWAIGQFFDKKKAMNYLKALFSYILGMITFYVLVFAIGGIIDLITKN